MFKHIVSVVILICFFSGTCFAQKTISEENLLKNGGFEDNWASENTFKARPAGWFVSSDSFGTYNVPNGGHNIPDNLSGIKKTSSGKYAWEISHIDWAAGYAWGYQVIPLKAGKYVLSGKVRTTGNDWKQYRICVRIGKDIRFLKNIKAAESDYESFAETFNIEKPGMQEVAIGIWRAKKGYGPYSHWDDIKLIAIETREVPLSYDSDYDGWIDRHEKRIGTDPFRPDTDGDGIVDSLDPEPLISQGKPEIDFLKGDIEYTKISKPTNFIWANLILRSTLSDRQVGMNILKTFADWSIYPSFGSFSRAPKYDEEDKWANEIMLTNRAKGLPTDTWRCLHEERSFPSVLGLDPNKNKPYRHDNPAVKALFAQWFVNVVLHTPSEFFSQVDENNWCPDVYDWNNFTAYLIKKGYKPGDFLAKTWADVKRPDIKLPRPEDAVGRSLLRELKLYAEFQQLDYYKNMAETVHQAKNDIKVNLGIFAPWSLSFGYYSNLPISDFYRVKDATRLEWDFYDWCYTGDYIRQGDMSAIEAGNQLLVDLVRKPIQITFSPEFSEKGRDESYYRLFMMSDLLSSDNITGVTFFYYGVKTEIGTFNMNNPRMKWLGEPLGKASKIYPLVQSMKEKRRILIVVDDPYHIGMGCKYDENGKRRVEKEYFRRMEYSRSWYYRSFKNIAAAGEDARFCIPRMLPGLDLSQYDAIVLDAEHIDDYPIELLKKWAAENGKKRCLFFQKYAGEFNELGYARKDVSWQHAKHVQLIPKRAKKLAALLSRVLTNRLHESQTYSSLLRVNIRGNENGDRIAVISNFSSKSLVFNFKLFSKHNKVLSKLGTSSHVQLRTNSKQTGVKGTIKPSEFEVLYFPAAKSLLDN